MPTKAEPETIGRKIPGEQPLDSYVTNAVAASAVLPAGKITTKGSMEIEATAPVA